MRAEFESVRSGFLGISVYGPKLVKLKKKFHQLVGTRNNFAYQISQLIASKIWSREEEIFNSYSNFGNYSDLEYVYMPKSSFGFGAMAVKNNSFDKIYNIKMYDKTIGKFFIFLFLSISKETRFSKFLQYGFGTWSY